MKTEVTVTLRDLEDLIVKARIIAEDASRSFNDVDFQPLDVPLYIEINNSNDSDRFSRIYAINADHDEVV